LDIGSTFGRKAIGLDSDCCGDVRFGSNAAIRSGSCCGGTICGMRTLLRIRKVEAKTTVPHDQPMSLSPTRSRKFGKKLVVVNDRMQRGYRYLLSAPIGRSFDPDFKPDLTPKTMLALGVFGGKYMTDSRNEFPENWFKGAKLSPRGRDPSLNYFGIEAGSPLSEWQKKGWIHPDDPRGWFQWYCRYYMGRRMPEEDIRQIKRWKAFRRHLEQVRMNCETGDFTCRPRQRQALLQWAYDSRII
jgi:hypothetical protein